MPEIGQTLAQRYKICRKLGQGGSAQVYLAYDRKSGRYRALKEIKAFGGGKNQGAAQQEAELIARLKYPYFPEILEILKTSEAEYIVMEYLEGETLGSRLRRLGPQPWQEVRRWGMDLCLMLGYLHGCNPPLIYRDMKPDNVIIQPGDNLRLIDFGAVVKCQGERQQGILLGTRGYAAPEQYDSGRQVDARTDIYGLGITLYQLLTGVAPDRFSDGEPYASHRKKLLPRKVDRILRGCILKEPERRYKDCEELRQVLMTCQSGI